MGGPTVHVVLLARHFNNDQYETVLVAGKESTGEGSMDAFVEEHGIKPVFIPHLQREISLLQDLKAFISLWRLFRKHKPHIVHTHTLKAGLLGRLAAGTAAIIFLAIAVLSIITAGNPNILGVQLISIGVCLGLLVFKFNPAKIFVNDTGSMLLSGILATTHLFTINYAFSAALDITFAMYKRFCNHCSIFKATTAISTMYY